ncbi:Uma2 family endonuclease [Gloeobacter morelensis MG652769]|uniref:Uma2 family endonuclease n=2 Tax=Gloeobacter TaxID=33071 RepID=A0ABY3PQG9_9CYAN|nr:Uma2 family endonuclease [Gloeobacter morelensis MG652769]
MGPILEQAQRTCIHLQLPPALHLSDDQLFELCRINRELRIERTALGNLIIMSPTGSETGARNASLTGQLWLWNRSTQMGQVFDSSSGFTLPNGAMRSPDAAWIRQDRWAALHPEQKKKFAPITPDFVAELKSPTDDLADLKAKMQEYIDNGVLLGWLLDPEQRQVWIYRPGLEAEILNNPVYISDARLHDFKLKTASVFSQTT